jgi:serine/threonine protein kinase
MSSGLENLMEEKKHPEEVFELLEKLGEGAYGAVWMGKHRETGELLAVKQVRKVQTK